MTEQKITNKNSGVFKKFFLPFLFCLMVIVLGFGSYFSFNSILEKFDNLALKTNETFTLIRQLQSKNEHLQNMLQNLQQSLERIPSTQTKYWKPLVIEHLLQLANLTLNTTGDVKLALTFLETTKHYADDPELSTIAYALNGDIAQLQAIPLVDVTSIVMQLEDLSQKIGSLPLIKQQTIANTNTPQLHANDNLTNSNIWQRVLTSAGTALKNIVVVRRNKINLLPSPEQETILRLNIKTKLLEAQLAVIHHQPQLYQACLEQVNSLMHNYFNITQDQTVSIINTLHELQKIDIKPPLAVPTASIIAIRNFLAHNNHAVTKTTLPITQLPNKETHAS